MTHRHEQLWIDRQQPPSAHGAKISVITLGEVMHNAVQLVRGAASLARIAGSVVHEPASAKRRENAEEHGQASVLHRRYAPAGSYWLLLALVCNLRGRAPRIHGVVVLHLTFIVLPE